MMPRTGNADDSERRHDGRAALCRYAVNATIAWSQPRTIELTGSIPAGGDPDDLDLSVLDPSAFAISQIARDLRAGGIAIDTTQFAPIPPDARVLWTHRSPPLPELLRRMWQPSDNLLAESLLGALAPTREGALDRERAWLRSIGVDPATVSSRTASGSRRTTGSPRAIS